MHTNRRKIAIRLGSLTAGGLLLVAMPTGASEANLRRPPMPCVVVRTGVYPIGSGFCPGTTGELDSSKIIRQLTAVGATTKPVNAIT
jgi:hypothetical protein